MMVVKTGSCRNRLAADALAGVGQRCGADTATESEQAGVSRGVQRADRKEQDYPKQMV